jgi:transcription initiation factor TFIID subunit TAF12
MKTSDINTVMLNNVTQSHTSCTEQIYEATSFTIQKGTMLKVHYNDNRQTLYTQSCNVVVVVVV